MRNVRPQLSYAAWLAVALILLLPPALSVPRVKAAQPSIPINIEERPFPKVSLQSETNRRLYFETPQVVINYCCQKIGILLAPLITQTIAS